MSERARARQSPLRDLMLELHQRGVKVKFYAGRPGKPDADVFFVELPDSMDLEDSIEILSRIDDAMTLSSTPKPRSRLSYDDAAFYVQQRNAMEIEAFVN